MAALPAQPFFTSPQQRAALARERFFDQGERPTGLVSEAVIQSWSRCFAARRDPGYAVSFDPVSRSHMHATLERNQALLRAAGDEIARLEAALGGTACRVLLTDANGVIVHATAAPPGSSEALLKLVSRVGINLGESQVGTNAPALVVKTRGPVTVLGSEHYFECVRSLHCAAAPIRDGRGRLAGVLDLTTEARPFAFDASALVGVYATVIENRLLQATAGADLVLQFQVCSSMLGTPLQALAGIDSHGHLAWCNGTAQKLLGLSGEESASVAAEQLFGVPLTQLLPRHAAKAMNQPFALRLPNGLTVWLRAQQGDPSATGAGGLAAVAPAAHEPRPAPEPIQATAPPAADAAHPTLDQMARDAVERALADCDGNISRAARTLGVSRGLLYRRLQRRSGGG